ncbi:uncharacterized protein [Equus caballus]|uniref:uncharacterized protein n=1 Tax=Equus caballus TaxID=9796 RepID=UPI0038B34690
MSALPQTQGPHGDENTLFLRQSWKWKVAIVFDQVSGRDSICPACGLRVCARSGLRTRFPQAPASQELFLPGFPSSSALARRGQERMRSPERAGADVAARQGPPPSGCGPPGAALLAPSGRARAGLREPGAAVQGAQSWAAGCSTPCLAAPEASFLPPFSSPRSPRPGLLRPPVRRGALGRLPHEVVCLLTDTSSGKYWKTDRR